MTKDMKLEERDINTLIEIGYEEKDISQIQKAIEVSTYNLHEAKPPYTEVKNLTASQAYKIVGRLEFLSGIARSAFHWSASRECLRRKEYLVGFDSTALFK